MIGKPEWFQRRKYTGWGLSPKTWQGWVYILVIAGIFILIQSPILSDFKIKFTITTIWAVVVIIDVLHMMIKVPKDEREYKIEAISERNASYAMVLVIGIAIVYQISTSIENPVIDWFLIITLGAGVLVKGVSNFILERKAI